MSYEKLKNFQVIFGREDFNYISDSNKIKEIKMIMENISKPFNDGQKLYYTDLLKKFSENLTSFYNQLIPHHKDTEKNLGDIESSYSIIYEKVEQCIKVFDEPDSKREKISKGYCRKLSKSFLYGLTKLLKGVRIAFEFSNIYLTKINREQLIKYIPDKREGLGRRYLFNKMGKYSFMKRIENFQKEELIEVIRLLTNPAEKQIRKQGNWLDLGYGKDVIRILCVHSPIGKDKVWFLFKTKEHNVYEKMLRSSSPKTAQFLAA